MSCLYNFGIKLAYLWNGANELTVNSKKMPLISLQQNSQSIHLAVWEITESHDELLAMLSSEILTDAELVDIHHPLKQVEFFASRLCIQALANRLNINYLGIKKDESGKPFLVGTDWHLSLTHTIKYIVVAMHPTNALGIDMEKPSEKLRRVAHKFLTETELKEAGDDLEKLCIYWSAKEALYKLYGKKKVSFIEHLHVSPFVKNDEFLIGKIQLPDYEAIIKMQATNWGDYWLVVAG